MKDIVLTDRGPKPIGPYSQGVRANGFLFISGQVAFDPATSQITGTDAAQQTHRQQLRHFPTHGGSPAPATGAAERATAANMPWRIRVGLGGQPGMTTSTGMTFETRPQLA